MVETLEIYSQDISPDGRVITPQTRTEPQRVSLESAREALEAFAAQPAMVLVDLDARLILRGPGGTISVRNNGGQLFGCQLPEVSNTFIACSPDEVILWAQKSGATPAGRPVDEEIPTGSRSARRRSILRSAWLLPLMLILAGFVGYLNFAGETPENIRMLSNSTDIAAAQKQVLGSYAVSFTPGQTVMTVDASALRIELLREEGQRTPQAVLSYRFGRRQPGGQLVLVAGNGAVLEMVSATRLRYGNTLYNRQETVHQ